MRLANAGKYYYMNIRVWFVFFFCFVFYGQPLFSMNTSTSPKFKVVITYFFSNQDDEKFWPMGFPPRNVNKYTTLAELKRKNPETQNDKRSKEQANLKSQLKQD